MKHAKDCSCDYSYICDACQALIDKEIEKEQRRERADLQEQRFEWMAACLKLIAEKLNVELPEEPS